MGTGNDLNGVHARRDLLSQVRLFARHSASRFRSRRGDYLTVAYAANLSQRIPALYGLVLLCLLLVSERFRGAAPAMMTGPVPLVMAAFAIWRLLYWLPERVAVRPVERLRLDLDLMNWSGGISALIFVGWALVLYSYGDDAQKSLIHYILSVLGFCGILCLAEAPFTALFFGVATAVPSTAFFILHGHPNAVFVSIVQVVLTMLLLVVANGHHRDFVRLELSREKIIRRERQAARLAEVNLSHATIDALTGVFNRRAFLALLEREVREPRGALPWLALVDLDGFKHINDTYGHAAGDAVLKAVADRIAEQPRLVGYGRLGGDEFALMLDGELSQDEAMAAMEALSARIRDPIADRGTVLRLSSSIGLKRIEGISVGDCLERADSALYKAKELGDGAVSLFDPEDEAAMRERVEITRQFNASPLEDCLRLLYQPVVDVEAGRVIGFEALARWTPDGETWHSPGSFFPLAEATGRTGELTRTILARALSECRAWESDRFLAVNLTPRDVLREGAAEAIEKLVREAGAPNEAITVEVTERALMLDARRAVRNLEAFRARGFRISFDDFGAGWSSIGQIHRLPLDVLKIDRELTRMLAIDPGARAIAGTILTLAWQLGIDCVIEGVENEAQAETARALGIRLMQGYHFGRPMPIEEALEAVRKVA